MVTEINLTKLKIKEKILDRMKSGGHKGYGQNRPNICCWVPEKL